MYSWHYLIFYILAATGWITAVAGNNTFSCVFLAQSTWLSAYNTTILNTTHYDVGTLDVAGKQNQVPLCAVLASVSYGSDDSLLSALWLPDEAQYSLRFMAVGNGGQAGVINYADMMAELNSGLGFAVAGGDGGHRDSDNDSGAGESVGAPGVYQPYLHDADQVRARLHTAISLFTPVSKAASSVLKTSTCLASHRQAG
jgi:hypothetical protein